jgi:hypothetical protein
MSVKKEEGICQLHVVTQFLGYLTMKEFVVQLICVLCDKKNVVMVLSIPHVLVYDSVIKYYRAAEVMFENYKVPALFLAKNAVCTSSPIFILWLFVKLEIRVPTSNISSHGYQVLTSFASGRSTSLVVDRCVICIVTIVWC